MRFLLLIKFVIQIELRKWWFHSLMSDNKVKNKPNQLYIDPFPLLKSSTINNSISVYVNPSVLINKTTEVQQKRSIGQNYSNESNSRRWHLCAFRKRSAECWNLKFSISGPLCSFFLKDRESGWNQNARRSRGGRDSIANPHMSLFAPPWYKEQGVCMWNWYGIKRGQFHKFLLIGISTTGRA